MRNSVIEMGNPFASGVGPRKNKQVSGERDGHEGVERDRREEQRQV
jgi:hypothetical protein